METTLWGELVPGPFAVGFRTSLTTDYSRYYGPPRGEPGSSRHFRPIFIAIWYPAIAPATGASPLTYGDYLHVSPNEDEAAFAPFLERLRAYLRDITIQYGLEKKPEELDEAGRQELADRERLPSRALRHAPSAGEGRFPIVFYHPGLGGSYEDNALLCEYLASHGYFVVSSAYQPEDATSLHVDWDLDRSIKDLGFLMNFVAADPLADVTRVGAVGQSYGGQALLAWSSETNCPVRAVVSLDSTLDYAEPDDPGFARLREPLSRAHNVAAAWLLFAVKERKPNWSRWDYLIHTPRWLAETGPLGHDDFTAQGMIGTVLRHGKATEAGLIRKRYEAVCGLTRRFLDGYVKQETEARVILMQQATPEPAGTTSSPPPAASLSPSEPLLTLTHKPASPGP